MHDARWRAARRSFWTTRIAIFQKLHLKHLEALGALIVGDSASMRPKQTSTSAQISALHNDSSSILRTGLFLTALHVSVDTKCSSEDHVFSNHILGSHLGATMPPIGLPMTR